MLSNKCTYALKAMLELAKREGVGPVTISDIAGCQEIPARFLEAILRQLKQGGLTDSQRGKDGGYVLAREAAAISIGEVIRLFEGPFFVPESGDGKPQAPTEVVFNELWGEADKALSDVYDNVSFRDLVDREQTARDRQATNYMI